MVEPGSELMRWLPELVTAAVVVLAAGAETLHMTRWRAISGLAFGPQRRPSIWAWLAPPIKVVATGAICWGLLSLWLAVEPRMLLANDIKPGEVKHVVLVLDVSPSMRLKDAGPDSNQSRMERASDVMESFFKRVVMKQYRCSVIAFYNQAKPVVVDTSDLDVVRNILSDLPMHYAFISGDTDLFSGLEAAAEVAKPWNPKSATLIVISDGDTVPPTGMPKMPASVKDVLVVGVGDPRTGSFIAGKQSRQDTSTLRQVALRLRGTYHNGNERHLSSALISQLTQATTKNLWEDFTRREWALIACGLGGLVYALLPLLLDFCGTRWRPGVRKPPQPIKVVREPRSEGSLSGQTGSVV